jgi:hypothetical protein
VDVSEQGVIAVHEPTLLAKYIITDDILGEYAMAVTLTWI